MVEAIEGATCGDPSKSRIRRCCVTNGPCCLCCRRQHVQTVLSRALYHGASDSSSMTLNESLSTPETETMVVCERHGEAFRVSSIKRHIGFLFQHVVAKRVSIACCRPLSSVVSSHKVKRAGHGLSPSGTIDTQAIQNERWHMC